MQRKATWSLASIAVLLLFAACSENPNALKSGARNPALLVTPPGSLDENVLKILALYPKGLETAATTRWSNVKAKAAAGLTDPAAAATAKQMLVELTDWIVKKTPEMDTPPDNEPKPAASARAILYMSMYVYGGSATLPPPYSPSADVVTGIVTPGAPATIVTPTKHAGVQLEAGSVDENTIVVITQNPTPYPDNCSGPLQTQLCQYPQFYKFEQFPHKALLKPAKFNVCHINDGENRRPLADHDRFRLAHTKPANPADYTTGSIIPTGGGENIEILPLVTQTFSTCEHNDYHDGTVAAAATGALSRFARAVGKMLSPKKAYAIDLGLGGLSKSFSDFNDVDPLGAPDRAVQSLAVAPVCGLVECLLQSGNHAFVNFNVTNVGTATAVGVPGIIRLVVPAIEGPPTDLPLGLFTAPALVPGKVVPVSVDVVIPATLSPGTYSVRVILGTGDVPEPEGGLVNNEMSVPISVTSSFAALRIQAIEEFATAYRGNGNGGASTGISEGQVNMAGLLSDEFLYAETFPTRLEIDRRSMQADNASIRAVFCDLQHARASIARAIAQAAIEPGTPEPTDLLTLAGFTEIFAAENWCSGVPTSQLDGAGVMSYGVQQSTTQLLESAIAHFDQVIAIAAANPAFAAAGNLARIGKARALLNMNDIAGAAAAAAAVPTSFSLTIGSDPSVVRQRNGVYQLANFERRWAVADNEGGNGLPYRSDNDARISFTNIGLGFDAVTTLFAQQKYASLGASVPLAQGIEARLIQAEADLRTGNLASFTANLNTVRASLGLPPLLAPDGQSQAVDMLFKERAYDLWLTSHRLGDLRRLIRDYDRKEYEVFPTGEYPKGGNYGTDVSFPIPVDTQFNPGGMACFGVIL